VLLLAARQPDLRGLLEEAGFTVETQRHPPNDGLPDVDLAVVFRGRLIGRNHAPARNPGRRGSYLRAHDAVDGVVAAPLEPHLEA